MSNKSSTSNGTTTTTTTTTKKSGSKIPSFLTKRRTTASSNNSNSSSSTSSSSLQTNPSSSSTSNNNNNNNNNSNNNNSNNSSNNPSNYSLHPTATNTAASSSNTSSNSNPNPNDVSSLSGALNNMKLSQDKSRDKDKEKDKDKRSKATKSSTSGKGDDKDPSKQQQQQQPAPFDKLVFKANGLTFMADRVIGNGSFGVVVRAVIQETNEVVAIKKVLQDKRYKNRELQIMQMISHPCIVQLRHSFFTNGDKPDEVYLNLVLEFIPDTVYRVSRHYSKMKQSVPIIYTKLYIYQLLRALAYIHSLGICHRDIKPQNLLLDPNSGILKLCDFGSAKMLVKGEPNVSYICSRYYRAPELIFGATNYTPAIDVWSAGCVMAELLLGQPLFPGESGVDQLVEIIKVLGTPTKEQIQSMNHTYTEYKFPQIKGHPWTKVFRSRTPPEAIELVGALLQYTPTTRLKPLEACAHPFFDELREENTMLPNGKPLPPVLFNFSPEEIKEAGPLLPKLIPPFAAVGHPELQDALANASNTTSNNNNN